MTRFCSYLLCPLFFFSFLSCTTNKPSGLETEVLVVGGGVSGTAAAIQAARNGAEVLLIEEGPWLGGMLTSAGVSATDGNHKLPSGIWGEFRQKLYDHYGGPEAVETGWVSNTLFEPHIGSQIWDEMASAEPLLKRMHGYRLNKVEVVSNRLHAVHFTSSPENTLIIYPQMSIDATELGDLLALAGVPFVTGNDGPHAVYDPNIQDLTYAAILKDYGKGADKSIPEPPGYDPREFDCICKELCDDPEKQVPDCETFLNYGRLPNDKFMLNWPNNGNDYYANPIPLTAEEREEVYQQAKYRSLQLLYHLQTKAGYKNLGLADDEFPTSDKLPLIPYHREARRIVGKIQLKVSDLQDPYADPRRPFYQEAIAVGDYPLDHHHDKNPDAEPQEFPPIPSFSIPYSVLVPEEIKGLIVAEKSISVSHRANGSTRLQPCVMLIGQAAGMAASQCIKNHSDASSLSIKTLQQSLLDAGCWLMPYLDIQPDQWFFQSLQKAGVTGKIQGTGIPYKWANQTWIYPDSAMLRSEFLSLLPSSRLDIPEPDANQTWMNRAMVLQELTTRIPGLAPGEKEVPFEDLDKKHAPVILHLQEKGLLKYWAEGENFYPRKLITRKEAAWLLDQLWPFFPDKEG